MASNSSFSEEDLAHGYCGLNVENVIYSLGIVGLAIEGMAKTCKEGSQTFNALECGAFFSVFLSELCWAASNAASMPWNCGLRHMKGADCAIESLSFVANTAELAADGFAAEINCFQGLSVPVEVRRRLSGSAAFAATMANRTKRSGALYALGILGSSSPRRGGGARQGSNASGAGYNANGANSSNSTNSTFTRAFDVAACYFTAENTVSTVVDAVFSIMTAVKACRHFQRHGDVENQQECAGDISNFLSDFATLVSYGALLASVCPLAPPKSKVPCITDWADVVAVLANYAAWGTSFGPSCLDSSTG